MHIVEVRIFWTSSPILVQVASVAIYHFGSTWLLFFVKGHEWEHNCEGQMKFCWVKVGSETNCNFLFKWKHVYGSFIAGLRRIYLFFSCYFNWTNSRSFINIAWRNTAFKLLQRINFQRELYYLFLSNFYSFQYRVTWTSST